MYRGIYRPVRGIVSAVERSRLLATAPGRQPTGHLVEVTPELRRKNYLTALACLAFVGGVYTYSIRKLKEEDIMELEEMTVVNMHESGLKATKFKALLKETEEEEARLAEALEDGQAEIPLEGEDKTAGGGWKRWVFFWRKSQ